MGEKDFSKTETKKKFCIIVFCYENKLNFLSYISDQKIENSIDLLLVTNENKSHYVSIKDFDRFMFHKTKKKNKKYYCKSCLQRFSSKNVLTEHKEVCLSINSPQSARLEKGTIEFKNYLKKTKTVPIKIYADFECNLKSVESYEGEGAYSEKYQDLVSCSFAFKLVRVDDKFSKSVFVFRGKNAAPEFIKAILKE